MGTVLALPKRIPAEDRRGNDRPVPLLCDSVAKYFAKNAQNLTVKGLVPPKGTWTTRRDCPFVPPSVLLCFIEGSYGMKPGNDKHRLLLENLPDAFAYHQIVTDGNGNPVDFIFLDVNPAFEQMTGLSRDKILGKKVTEALPGIANARFNWIDTYGRVALGGEIACFEQYFEPLDRCYAVSAYSDEPGFFAVLFHDITALEKKKEALETLVKLTQKNLQLSVGSLDYQHLTDDLLQLSGAKFVAINTYEENGTKTVTRAISGITDNIRRASELLGFELTGKAWDVIPERDRSIKDGRLLRFANLYESGSGAISRQSAFLLEKLFGLGEVYVIEIAHQGQSLGDFILFMSRGQTIITPRSIELYANLAGVMLLRNQAEQALQDKDSQQVILLDNIETQVWYLTDAETYGSVNQARADFFGVEKKDMENKSLYDLMSTRNEAEICIAGNQDVFSQKQKIHSEELAFNGSGEPRLLSITKVPKLDSHNNVEYVVCSAEDITERKQTEEALKASEEQLNLFFSQSLDGFFIMMLDEPVTWDEHTDKEKALDYIMHHLRMTRVNQSMLDQYQAKEEDFLGLTPHDLFQHDLEHGRHIMRGVFEQGRWHVETKEQRLDGTPMWVEGDYICMYDPAGRVTGHFGIQRDITERKWAEQALRDSEEKFRFLVDYSYDLIWILQSDGVFSYVSPSWEATLGYEPSYMAGKSFKPFVHPEDAAICENYMSRVIEAGKALPGPQYRVRHADGSWQWHEGNITPVFSGDGSFMYFVGVSRDITERKQMEDTLSYRLQLERVLSEISSRFLNLPAEQIAEGIDYTLKRTGEFFQVDRSYVFQFSADEQIMSNTHEWCAAGIEPQSDKIQQQQVESLPWWAEQIRARYYVHIPDVQKLPPEAAAEREEFQRQGIQSLLTVPLRSKNRLIGFFGFDSVAAKTTWTEESISFLRVIADILVNAFEKNRAEQKITDYTLELELKGIELEELYRQLDVEVDKARYIHEKSLPKELPRVEGLSMQAYYQPAQRMGGDFYNTIKADNKLIFYLSDVTGHGMEGALLSVFTKEAINSYITLKPEEIEPARILRHLNRQYRQENYPADYFICIFLMVLDLETMELTYTAAGFQELPLVQRGCGEKLRLAAEGPPVSSTIPEELMDYTEGSIQLAPGTTILLSTDGLTEQVADEKPYNGRLEQVFYDHSLLPPEMILSAIQEDFCRFNHGSLQGDDDITLLLIQAKPAETQKLHLELDSNTGALASLRQAVLNVLPEGETTELFLLGLHELAANAMEHGNNFDPHKKITVHLTVTEQYLFAAIQDQGPGFDWLQKKDRPLALESDQERGRGIAMTQLCGGKLYYNETGTRACFAVEK